MNIPDDVFPRLEKLYTGLISDVLDEEFGFRSNVYVMSSEIRPLYFGAVAAGRASTALAVPIFNEINKPYSGLMEFIGDLKPGDVVVAAQSAGNNSGLWGSLCSTAARYKGARGAVIEGITRDTRAIVEMRFPVFIKGIAPFDSQGRMEIIAHDIPIMCGGVWVKPGDLIFGDHDGVIAIPQDIAIDIISLAEEKLKKEKGFEEGLRSGESMTEMFKKYGVL